jgi:hypothetical protein
MIDRKPDIFTLPPGHRLALCIVVAAHRDTSVSGDHETAFAGVTARGNAVA